MTEDLQIVQVSLTDRQSLLKIQDLRRLAWSANGEVPDFIARQNILEDEHDLHAMQWAIFVGNNAVAAMRMCIHPNIETSPDPEAYGGYERLFPGPVASMTRLVVAPAFRGIGLGATLRKMRIDTAEKMGCGSIAVVVEQKSIMKSLEAEGFKNLGESPVRYLKALPTYVFCKTIFNA